jgi:pimeloyl-ACP methyl ester carboxylesterase
MGESMTSADVVAEHRAAGRHFQAGGLTGFVREQGAGEPVVCLHGVPTSSFLYRKVLAELAQRGLRGVAFDLPGLGLADRPASFNYTWTGLGAYCASAVDALGLHRFHLVVHDIGGPVGFELATRVPERVASLTVLNESARRAAGIDQVHTVPAKHFPQEDQPATVADHVAAICGEGQRRA